MASGPEKSRGPGSPQLRAEAAAAVRTVWPRLAQALGQAGADPQALAREMETALRAAALRIGTASQVQTQAALTGIEEAIRGLESVQVLNAMANETGTSLVLPLPLAQGWGAQEGRLLFYKPPHKSGTDPGERPLRLVFLLDMTKLGPVRVDVSMIKKSLMINLYLTKPEALQEVSRKLAGLEKNLTEKGYQIRSLAARPVRTAPALEEVAPQPLEAAPKGFIDLKA